MNTAVCSITTIESTTYNAVKKVYFISFKFNGTDTATTKLDCILIFKLEEGIQGISLFVDSFQSSSECIDIGL